MSVSLEYLQRCCAETGYAVSPLEKVVRLKRWYDSGKWLEPSPGIRF